jgi:hypothetical protein
MDVYRNHDASSQTEGRRPQSSPRQMSPLYTTEDTESRMLPKLYLQLVPTDLLRFSIRMYALYFWRHIPIDAMGSVCHLT